MNFYIYEVDFFDDYSNSEKHYQGVAVGETYAEAVKALTTYYGEIEIISMNLAAIDAEGCIELSAAEINRIKEGEFLD